MRFSALFVLVLVTGCQYETDVIDRPGDTDQTVTTDSDSDVPVDTDVADTDQVVDTDVTDTAEEPCGLTVQWIVTSPTVTPNTFSMPELEVGSTCESDIGLDSLQLTFAGGQWVSILPDPRLGVGLNDTQHLNVWLPESTECDMACALVWSIDLSGNGIVVNSEKSASFGFSIAGFYQTSQISAIDELWDGVDDPVLLTAVVGFHADHEAGGAISGVTSIIIDN